MFSEQSELRGDINHVSRELTRARYNYFARSPQYRSARQDLSITRHVARVRNAHGKRAKSAVATMRHRKSESGIDSSENNSIFHKDFKRFY